MPHFTESLDALRREAPARFLETDQFAEMLSTYHKLKPLALSKPKSFAKQCAEYDFTRIYPLMDAFLAENDLSAPDRLAALAGESAPETVSFASALIDIYADSVAKLTRETEYDTVGNSPATYFICGVWANMKRGREFHPASNGITVTYSQPDAYGNQSISYKNKDYEMTLIFEAVDKYTKNLSWTAHRLLIYTLMCGNRDGWRGNAADFNLADYMAWSGLASRDAAYRQLKKDVQSITNLKLTAESYKKYFESFYITHLATEANIKKYTGEVHIAFAENVRLFLTQYYQLIPDWMGQLSENAYRLAYYLYYRARKAPLDEDGSFLVRVEDIIQYIGLPTKEEVKNRNYDEAIIRPFNKAVEEIESIANGSIHMSFDYDNINSFLAGKMTVGSSKRAKSAAGRPNRPPKQGRPRRAPRPQIPEPTASTTSLHERKSLFRARRPSKPPQFRRFFPYPSASVQKSTHKPLQIRKKPVFSRETCITSPQSGHTTSFLPTSSRAAATSNRAVPTSHRAKNHFPPFLFSDFKAFFYHFCPTLFSLWIFKINYGHAPNLLRRVAVLYYLQKRSPKGAFSHARHLRHAPPLPLRLPPRQGHRPATALPLPEPGPP